ncbi:MAG: Asp23/Gls24 family envelope stress response protein [Andreesenia angusta]|nr:Asp23/Gls24 family envelope stress response protein [Andreesenia angusta]
MNNKTENKSKLESQYNEVADVNKKEREDAPKHESKLTIDDNVVEKIAAIASSEVDGVLDMSGNIFNSITGTFGSDNLTKGVSAEVGDKQAAIDLKLILEYGASAPKVFNKLKSLVKEQVGLMTGLEVVEVNVRVTDVMTRKQYQQENEKKDKKNLE